MNLFLKYFLGLIIVVFLCTSCGNFSKNDEDIKGTNELIALETYKVDLDSAIAKFREHYPEVQVTAVHFKYLSKKYYYVIEGVHNNVKYSLKIFADSNKSEPSESALSNDDKIIPLVTEGIITPIEAMSEPLQVISGLDNYPGSITGWSIWMNSDLPCYFVFFENTQYKTMAQVNAYDGIFLNLITFDK